MPLLCLELRVLIADSMLALAEDHLNDIMSNVGAAITSALAVYVGTASFCHCVVMHVFSHMSMWMCMFAPCKAGCVLSSCFVSSMDKSIQRLEESGCGHVVMHQTISYARASLIVQEHGSLRAV